MAPEIDPPTSADGLWFWDGTEWRSLLSADGRTRWDGRAWVARSDASFSPAQSPPPPAGGLPSPVLTPQPAALAPPVGAPAPLASAVRLVYAGFWIRLLASLIDGIIVGIPITVASLALMAPALASNADPAQLNAVTAPVELLGVIASFGYFVYFWTTGATLGMRLVGVRVVDAITLQAIPPGKAVLRYLGYLVASFCCYIGLIWAAFDPRKQGWHDKIAGTVVVHRP